MPQTLLRKKCQYCERRFSKAEHLKRHERSHTGERPYTCRLCDKSFSRSDVLHRHVRRHAQGLSEDADAEVEAEVEDSGTGQDRIELQVSSGAVRNLDNDTIIFEPTAPSWRRLQDGTTSSQLIGQTTEPVAAAHESHPSWNAGFSSGLEHQMNPHERLGHVHVDQDTNPRDADTFMAVHQEQPSFPLSASTEGHQRPIQPADMQQPEILAQHPASSTTSVYPEIPPIASGIFEGRRQESMPQNRSSLWACGLWDTQSLSAANWYHDFEEFGEGAYSFRDTFPIMPDSAAFDFMDVTDPIHLPNRAPCLSPPSQRSNDDIPDERFEKLKRCWPNRRDDAIRLMRTLWQDVVSHTEENLFSQAFSPPRSPDDHRQSGSRWGLDEECRIRLQRDCGFSFLTEHPRPARCNNNNNPIDHDPSTRESVSGSPHSSHPIASTVIDFPPAEILDMSLDLYFRRFHTLIPFIHVPTFDAKSTPSSMLFSMCLIGLTVLNTDGATKFLRICFSSTLEKCSTELASRSLGRCTPPQLMSTFAACYLTVNLATMSPDTAHHEQALQLSVQMISIAQRHGLFTANDGDPLTMTLIAQHTDDEQRWKSWARIESAKRLIVCLIMADSWSAYMFHTNPIIHTDRLQILLSCEDALFRAGSAKKWAQIVHSGSLVLMPSLALDPSSAHLPKFDTLLDDFGMYGLLSIIWLYILEADYRLLPGSTNGPKGKLRVPSEVYAQDQRVRFVGSLLFNVVDSYGDRFERMNPNCMVLWHSMCMMLTTDLRIIELGAGCAGAGRARQALDDIAAWSQTAAARRACVHAGQTFMIMSKRKVSDGTMFHSETTLFMSALVLGLYLLTVSNTSEVGGEETLESLELLDDVDWRTVVHEGLTPNKPPYNGAESLAKRFIRDGGSIQFSGLIHHGGYQSARRILLDYAGLLGDVGKWKVRDYSRVLRILSDTLLEVDVPASEDDF